MTVTGPHAGPGAVTMPLGQGSLGNVNVAQLQQLLQLSQWQLQGDRPHYSSLTGPGFNLSSTSYAPGHRHGGAAHAYHGTPSINLVSPLLKDLAFN
jgi:hypothetical protein